MEENLTTYKTIDTHGKSQVELILQVYDGAIGAFESARKGFGEGDNETGRAQIERARKFVTHLYSTLNPDEGGAIADNLAKIYSYIVNQTNVIEAVKDSQQIDDMISILGNLREAWVAIKEDQESVSSTPAAGTPMNTFSIDG